MKYKKRREKAGITFSTMVKELGIPENKYKEVEEGKRNLEGNMLDKFMNVLNRKKEVEFNQLSKIKQIDEWIKSGEVYTDIEKYGYKNQRILANALGVSQSVLSCFLRDDKIRPVSDDKKIKIYDFLHDPLNKYIGENKVEKPKLTNYVDWFYKNIGKLMKKYNISQKELSKICGCTVSNINHILNKNYNPSKKVAKSVYDYFNKQNERIEEEVVKEPIVEKVEEKVMEEKVVEEKAENKDNIKELNELRTELLEKELILIKKNNKIDKLKRQIMLYEKMIERL